MAYNGPIQPFPRKKTKVLIFWYLMILFPLVLCIDASIADTESKNFIGNGAHFVKPRQETIQGDGISNNKFNFVNMKTLTEEQYDCVLKNFCEKKTSEMYILYYQTDGSMVKKYRGSCN